MPIVNIPGYEKPISFPDDMATEQIQAEAARLYQEKLIERSGGDRFRAAVADRFQIDPEQVQYGGSGPYRAQAGLRSDVPTEELLSYQRMFPDMFFNLVEHPKTGKQYPVGLTESGGAWIPNKPGLDMGDVVQLTGQEGLPMVAGAGAVALSGPLAGIITGPLAYGATKGLQEIGQRVFNTGTETFPEAAGRIGTQTAWELGGAGVAQLAGQGVKAASGTIFTKTPPQLRRDVQSVQAGLDEGVPLGPIKPYQLTENQVLQSAARQRLRAIGGTGEMVEQQRNLVLKEGVPELRALPEEQADEVMAETAKRLRNNVYEGLPKPPKSFTEGGASMGRGFQEAYDTSNREIRAAYAKTDQYQQLEKPIFDTGAFQDRVQSYGIQGLGDAIEEAGKIVDTQGKPLTVEMVDSFVNVGKPEGKLARAIALLGRLRPEQVDYKVLQRLRTLAGDMHKDFKFQAGDSYQAAMADKFRGEVTEILKNPVNKADTPNYITSFEAATAKAREQFQWMENSIIQKSLKDKRIPRFVYQELANNPGKITDDVRNIIDRYSPAQAGRMRNDILGTMVQTSERKGSPLAPRLQELAENDPEVLNWLTGGPKAAGELMEKAKQIDAFNKSGYRDIYEQAAATSQSRVQVLKEQATNPKTTQAFLKSLGPDVAGLQMARQTVGDALLDGVITRNPETGNYAYDLTTYAKNKAMAEKSGWWDSVLDARSRTRFDALESYMRLTRQAADTGAGLETASTGSMISQFRLLDVLMSQVGHKVMGGWLTSNTVGDKVFNHILRDPKETGRTVGKLLNVMGMAAGLQAREVTDWAATQGDAARREAATRATQTP
jgi:hypothetical protein